MFRKIFSSIMIYIEVVLTSLNLKENDKYLSSLPTLTRRSPKWSRFRDSHLDSEACCQICGQFDRKYLVVHHIKPFHLFPELELDPDNLITVCTNGPGGLNCHFVFCHKSNWLDFEPDIRNLANLLYPYLSKHYTPPKH